MVKKTRDPEFNMSEAIRAILAENPNVYLLNTNTDARIFFTVNEDSIDVLDVVRADSLKTFGGSRAQGPQ